MVALPLPLPKKVVPLPILVYVALVGFISIKKYLLTLVSYNNPYRLPDALSNVIFIIFSPVGGVTTGLEITFPLVAFIPKRTELEALEVGSKR